MNKAQHCWRCEKACTQQCSRCKVAFYCSKECQKQDKWRHKPDCDSANVKRTCLSCGLEQSGTMQCTNCLDAAYCSVECQKNHWERHRRICQDTVDRTLKLADDIKELNKKISVISGGVIGTYYWGNLPAVDLLNLPMNEGETFADPLSLLLCGVGDPRNVLLTIASLPEVYKQPVTFVLNDICPCTLARTVMLLYMLYKGGIAIYERVVRIWYSVRISEQDSDDLTCALQDLVTTNELRTLTGGVMMIPTEHLRQLQIVWTKWLRLSKRKGSWVEDSRREANSFDPERNDGVIVYLHAIPIEHRKSAQHFLDTGIFHSSRNALELTRQNVTLTGRGSHPFTADVNFHYSIPTDVLPFIGWDYREVKKTCYSTSLPKMYTTYLSGILQKSSQKLQRDQLRFRFLLCDVANIEAWLPCDLTYDRITTSNLWDYCPLAVLLRKLKDSLNTSNSHAVMFTETHNWVRDFMPEIMHVLANRLTLDDLCKRALQDTGNPELAYLAGQPALVEYQNLTSEFMMFLRASLLTSCPDKEIAAFKRKKRIPSVKSLASSMGLQIRDFIKNENTVVPFRWALNCRRVVMLRGDERALEWKLVPTDEGSPIIPPEADLD
ncbi:uncharacterized protein [Montipora capricornis]|uniref:uncharacterized protein n=1 Tax=Montipora capricornis TaxID=246305 RepID=UPI0035F20013